MKMVKVALIITALMMPMTAQAGGPIFNNPFAVLMRALQGEDDVDRQRLIDSYRRSGQSKKEIVEGDCCFIPTNRPWSGGGRGGGGTRRK